MNRNIVLVVVAGGNLALNWEDDNLPAIVDAWYKRRAGRPCHWPMVLFGDYQSRRTSAADILQKES